MIRGAGVLVVAAGLTVRYRLSGFWAKYLGVALWIMALYTLLPFALFNVERVDRRRLTGPPMRRSD